MQLRNRYKYIYVQRRGGGGGGGSGGNTSAEPMTARPAAVAGQVTLMGERKGEKRGEKRRGEEKKELFSGQGSRTETSECRR